MLGVWPRPDQRFVADNPADQSDVAMYRAIVQRVQAGEPYHAAVNTELRARNFPTGSARNWRPPVLAFALAAHLGAARIVLLLLTVAVLVTVAVVFRRAPPELTLLAIGLQLGTVVTALEPQTVYMSEAWAGVLIALSILAYMHQRAGIAVACGLLALTVRELAAPYVLACLGLALYAGRTREARAWLIGLIVVAVYYAWHLRAASAFSGATAIVRVARCLPPRVTSIVVIDAPTALLASTR